MKTIGIYNCYTGVPADAIPFFQACGYNTYQRWDLGWTIWPEKHAAYYGEMVEDMNRMRAAGFRVYILLNINMRQCPSGGREGYLGRPLMRMALGRSSSRLRRACLAGSVFSPTTIMRRASSPYGRPS